MAKTTGPLLSFGARGAIGKTVVASSWRGIGTMRQYVVPANPRTTAQQTNRTRFAFLRELWKRLPSNAQAAFNAYAQGRQFTGMNAFVGENNRLLVGETTLANLEMSPGAGGGLAPVSVTAVAGGATGEIDVTIVPPVQLPDGWSITSAQFVALPDQDPTGILSGIISSGSDATNPYEATLTGFTPNDTIFAYAWFVYEKDNGRPAYSVSLADSAVAPA